MTGVQSVLFRSHAKFENGVLRLSIPKKAAEEIEADKYVSIEG